MSFRNALRCGTLAAATLMLAADAGAVDPIKIPSDGYIGGAGSLSGSSVLPGGSSFDPFAPSGSYSTDPLSQQRINPQLNPGLPAEQPRWRLGVYTLDTPTGVQVVKVTQGSPGHAAGLEERDMIVAVAGYQVGMIENTRRELGQAFNDYVRDDGHVNLLVQDNRTGKLTNLHVHLESRFERIEGTVTFRDEVRLPRNAQVRIDLYETIRQGVTPIPIVSKTITDLNRRPIPFSIDYDPTIIDPRRKYEIHATVVADNQTYYRTHNPYPVITDGYPRVVDLRLYSTSNQYGHQDGGYASNRDEQLDQIIRWYQQYLNRPMRPQEQQVYTDSITRGESLDEIRARLLGLPEFYTRSGSDDEAYIRNLYEVVLNRRPTQQEVDAWLRQLNQRNGIRTDLAREFLAQVSKQR